MARPKLTFYLDLQSPYAYLAYYFTRHSQTFSDCDITYVPVLMIGLVKAGVSNPPWNIPNRVDYLWKDIARCAAEASVPWRAGLPADYPLARTSEVQRVIAACSELYPDHQPALLDALYHAFWIEKQGVQSLKTFQPIIEGVLGESRAAEVVQRRRVSHSQSLEQDIQRIVRANTEEATASGAVGLPWFVATDVSGKKEEFWGFDRLQTHVVRFLELEDASARL
ncbi:uncharacterized protein LTR77_003506 [Saxophila tyrrhenica]|uniref:Glutathione S-transferase kappa n=1 Tax=Saxophila tyrrhenica TaxID=1690608 RepID=A0AAV9PDV2_9PEZI|nr:hypothetical protein LTR77_003506 [Saxophila tyrrhenica]